MVMELGFGAAPADAAPLSERTFGPTGYDHVRLGMTVRQARATGRIDHRVKTGSGRCTGWRLKGRRKGAVLISKKYGVAAIAVASRARTPQGVGLDSLRWELKRAYPDLKFHSDPARADVAVPGHPNARFDFGFKDGKVARLLLTLAGQDCF
ncbi:hypothetical protein J5X84_38570 [Streptosporangiaceae bacterium NEAU-GS5]|nr:hypothetical protein [Streptosporangiaceae bacterium NEAU-GS5]